MEKYAASCGLYCGACSSMLTNERHNGAPDASHFVCEYAESPCAGCGDDCRAGCEFIVCCHGRGIDNCAFCPDFPCTMITIFSREEWIHHRDVLDNLSRIKEVGLVAWLEEQRRQWSCPGCGKRTHWYQNRCHSCGAEWSGRYDTAESNTQ